MALKIIWKIKKRLQHQHTNWGCKQFRNHTDISWIIFRICTFHSYYFGLFKKCITNLNPNCLKITVQNKKNQISETGLGCAEKNGSDHCIVLIITALTWGWWRVLCVHSCPLHGNNSKVDFMVRTCLIHLRNCTK